MAKKKNKTEDQFAQIEETLSRTEQYIEKNQENLVRIVLGTVVIIALFMGYQKFYIAPMEKEAQADMFMAELYFEKDSFNLALTGEDNIFIGFIDIADEYSGTKAAELANYYAGLSYLNTGDFENAIEYLDDFSSNDIILSSLALGCIGDAYMELEDSNNALSYYEDAASYTDNEFTTPRYMLKQAMIHESNGDYADALALYKGIEEDYKSSREGNGIEKYIARAENR